MPVQIWPSRLVLCENQVGLQSSHLLIMSDAFVGCACLSIDIKPMCAMVFWHGLIITPQCKHQSEAVVYIAIVMVPNI